MTIEIDAKGLACPAPVLQTKKAVEDGRPETIKVLVDNGAAKENVTRFLKSQGYESAVTENGGVFTISASSTGEPPEPGPEPDYLACDIPGAQRKIMVLAASNCMGRGDDVLGEKLMMNYIATLKEMGPELWRLVLVNSGVKMAIEGSQVLPHILDLEKAGVSVLVCGTCLDHFGILEQKQVGETTNMLDIVTSMQLADKVIKV
ncbi:selenium metabolism protein YedF [Desulfatibacillum alkenivorans DSM 16219]|jgi:selenium metabolism protein YedF|uniref:Selenium metabolism protein YedF n=1 Tax=Desulfatibacillum alkenivorans DSM 16219 TaxID=1121393 RepID=A0A1M6RWB1_9BACT|nr:sulfurtransferase-like selenium metabolism protein YedF [Desulfatibacillum alkenivorans]SHK36547.1 selenium metabolism protein YedF [Desulfatibacillum alkenivorans DSM 16219]